MNSNKIFYLNDFCRVANLFNNQLTELQSIVDKFLSKKKQTTYLENPFNQIYIYGSTFNEQDKSFSYNELYVNFNTNLKINTNFDLTILDDVLILKDYTYSMFENLNNTFINFLVTTANINWLYDNNINDELTDDCVLSIKIANDILYKNKNEVFKQITVNSNSNLMPTIKNLNEFFNLKNKNTIICQISDMDGVNFSFKNKIFKSNLPLIIKVNTIEQTTNVLNLSNISSNDLLFIRRDLTNLNKLKISDMNSYEDDDILNNKSINMLFENYKNNDDTTIDSSYNIEISQSSNQAVTAHKVLSIIKTYVEEYYLNTLQTNLDNLPANNALKIIMYYKNKIQEMKSAYLLINDYTITDFYLYNNFCLKASFPFTLKKQKECIEANVSIEESNQILTKNTFKCWLKECLNERVRG